MPPLYIYIQGGSDDEDGIQRYDSDNDQWALVSKMNQPKKNHAVSAVNFDDVCIQGIFTFIQLHLPKQIRYLKIYPKKVPKNVKIDGRYDKIVNFIYLTAAALNFVLVWVSVETLFSKDKCFDQREIIFPHKV